MDFFTKAQQMKEQEAENKQQIEDKTSAELLQELERAKTIRDSKRNAEELTREL